ncbi:MAG: nuclear transport factor 2 family protein [Chloroflexota bacterium]|nr:nuclear transport factor 2 family protein [Chloroflexota bacterium]
MKAFRIALLLGTVTIFFVLPLRTRAQAIDPVAIATAWVTAVSLHDVETALSFLGDDAYVTFVLPGDAGNNVYEGKDQVRQLLQGYILDNRDVSLIQTPEVVNGTTTWVERHSANSLGQSGVDSVDIRADAIIQDGKIKSLLYELTDASAAKVAAAAQASKRGTAGMPRTGSQASTRYVWAEVFAFAAILCGFCGALLRGLSKKRS